MGIVSIFETNLIGVRKTIETNLNNKQDIINSIKQYKDSLYVINSDESLYYIFDSKIIFKYKKNKYKLLQDYYTKHLYSSLIKLLIDKNHSIDKKINVIIFLLYNYWFYKKDNMMDISHNVCVSIESLIYVLIDKGLTLYKDFDTGTIVKKLRDQWLMEKTVYESFNINRYSR